MSLQDPRTWDELLGGTEATSGVRVSHTTAMQVPAVHQSVSIISGDIASSTLNCFKRTADDERQVDWSHPAQFLVAVRPNEEMPAFEFWRRLMLHALLWQNGYAFIGMKGGKLDYLANLLPDRTTSHRDKQGNLFYVTEVDAQLVPIPAHRIIHVKGLSIENGKGLDLVTLARNSIGLAIAAEGFASRFFSNGAQAGGVLEIPMGFSAKAKDNIEDSFRKKYTGKDNWFKTIVLRDGAKFHQTMVNSQQSQQHELREDQVREIARFFNLPPFKLGLSDSVSYNSAEQSQLVYITGCLRHWFSAVQGEVDIKLLSERELRDRTHYFEHNFTKLIEVDAKSLAEVLEIERRNEIINANEWRKKINLPKRKDPGGEDYINPNTKSAVDAKTKTGDSEGGDTPDVPVTDGADVQATALNGAQITALIDIAERLAMEQLPPEGTRALIEAAFPMMDKDLIDTIVKELDRFTPKPPPEPPAPKEKASPKSDALRDLFNDTVNRVARRVCFDARTSAKKPQNFTTWLDGKAQEHRAIFQDHLRPVLRVMDEETTEIQLVGLEGRFFGVILDALTPIVDPPYSRTDLVANVDSRCAEFEATIAESLYQSLSGAE